MPQRQVRRPARSMDTTDDLVESYIQPSKTYATGIIHGVAIGMIIGAAFGLIAALLS